MTILPTAVRDYLIRSAESEPVRIDWRNPVSLGLSVVLVSAVALLVVMHGICWGWRVLTGEPTPHALGALFWLGAEFSVPSWFSSLMLGLSSATLLAIAMVRRRIGWPPAAMAALAAVMVFLSMDEMLSFHEVALPQLTRPFFPDAPSTARTWTIAGVALAAIVAGAMLPTLARLPVQTRRLMVIAGAVYVAGACGFEALSGFFDGPTSYWPDPTLYTAAMTMEETLEMLGVVILMHALTSYGLALLATPQARRRLSAAS